MPLRLRRAALLSGIPGVTLAEACKRYQVKKGELQRVRKQLGPVWLQPAPEDLLFAVLTGYGARKSGRLADPAGIAEYIDYVNKDGCDAAEVRAMLRSRARRGFVALSGDRWKLLQPWPFL
jgi:hypothetical protein